MTNAAGGRARGTIIVAVALCVLSLGTPWYRVVAADARVVGVPAYRLEGRFFLAIAIACLVVAINRRSQPRVASRAVSVAILVLVVMLGHGLRIVARNIGVLSMTPTSVVLTVATIVLLLSVRFDPQHADLTNRPQNRSVPADRLPR